VLLYELLTGSTPFDAKELMASGIDAMRKTICEKEPMRPSTKLTQELIAADVSPHQSSAGLAIPTQEEVSADSRQRLRLKEQIQRVQGDLDWIVMKCLEKDRTRRYETANALASDIQRHLNNEPVFARPPSAAYRFQKMVRRNKVAVGAATVVTTALILGLAVSLWQMVAARRARSGEQQQRLAAQSAQKNAETEQKRADAQAQQSRRLRYAAEMNLAHQSLKQNNLGRARRLLDGHRPQPGEEDLRGWEWRYLWQLTRSSAVTLTNRPTTRGFSVSFSPDGSRLAVGWFDGRVEMWDVAGRQLVRALTDREYRHQGRVAFSPVRNILAATSEPKTVVLYDLDSGRESILWRGPDQGEWEVRDLDFSRDGSRLVIYAGIPSARIYGGETPDLGEQLGDQVWVVNLSSFQTERSHPTAFSAGRLHRGARLSPDNRRLYVAHSDRLNRCYTIQCIDLVTGQELWETEREQASGVTALAISPDGKVVVSGSGYEDPTIRIWEADTGRPSFRLVGHTRWVGDLVFTRDGKYLISAAGDQSLRFWNTSTWNETKVLRGHAEEIYGVAISEATQLVASTGKDGALLLWEKDGNGITDGHIRLPEDLHENEVLPLDRTRMLLLPRGKPPELIDLKRDSAPTSLPEVGSSTDFLGWFGTNLACHWNGTNQLLIREWRGAQFNLRAAIALDSGTRPAGLAYNPSRQLLAWSEETSPTAVSLVSLAAHARRIELRSDVSGLVPFRFSEDGNYLSAMTKGRDILRVWNVEAAQVVASIGGRIRDAIFAARGRVLVVAIAQGNDHETVFYDLAYPSRAPRLVAGKELSRLLAVSPDGELVASTTDGGLVQLFDPAIGERIASIHGHMGGAFGIAFSPDGRRLISCAGGGEAVKLWDVGTRQELLTLNGPGSQLHGAKWSADGDVILAGVPWQAWRAPSWEDIATAEAKEKTDIKQP